MLRLSLFALMVGLASAGIASAQERAPSVMKQCGDKWQAAKAAGTTGDVTWTQFLSGCRAEIAAQPTSAATAPPSTPAPAPAATPAHAAPAVAPTANAVVSSKSAVSTPDASDLATRLVSAGLIGLWDTNGCVKAGPSFSMAFALEGARGALVAISDGPLVFTVSSIRDLQIADPAAMRIRLEKVMVSGKSDGISNGIMTVHLQEQQLRISDFHDNAGGALIENGRSNLTKVDVPPLTKCSQELFVKATKIIESKLASLSQNGSPLDAERAAATAPATPSFDCTTAKSGAARLICSDAELSKADADLGKAFHTSLARLEGADKSAAIKDQVQWIRVRNTRCGLNGKEDAPIDMLAAAKGCMLQAMQSRIQYFGGANVPAPPADQPQPTASGKTEAPKALQDGLAAIKDRDYATALHLLRPLADEGNADAQSQIGHMYAHGQGVANDDVEAVKRYRKAADQGNSEAQNNLGFMYHEGRGVANDDVEALKWFRKAADQGNAEGQFDLGNAYLNGWGVMQNFAEGEEWYRKAADQGLAQAKTSLALLPASREFNGWSKPFEVNCFDVANGTRVVIWDDLRKTPIWGQRFMSGGVQLESAADFDSLADQSKLARFVAVLYTSAAEYCQKEASAGKGVFTPNFGVILITPPYPYANWSAKVMWWSNGTTVSVIEPNISRFSKNIAEQLRSIRQNQAAYEQAQRDRAAQEARNAEIIQTNMYNFTSKTGVQQWINREELRSNAIRFKGQIVGVFAYFTQLESETEGIFGNSMLGATDTLIVTGIDATKLKKNQEVIMAVRVNGLRPHLSVQVPDLSLVGIAYCQQQHCSEFGNVPN